MSDNIPSFDIQVEIMKRLPVKSLIRFRSLSNTWKSLIDSSDFVASYSAQLQHLLLLNSEHEDGDDCFLIVEDDSFPQHKVSVPLPIELFKYYHIHGCSNGLLCFSGIFQEDDVSPEIMVFLLNPSIRKAVAVVVPDEDSVIYGYNIGFGVCRETMDPKIVKIRHIKHWDDIESVVSIPWQVEVFTLSTGAWRSSYSNVPRKSIQFKEHEEVLEVDGFLYWLASDRIVADGGIRYYNMIVSFDMTSEEFTEVKIPDSLAYKDGLSMYKLRESLVVVHEYDEGSTVWKMEDGFPKTFTKIFTINRLDGLIRGFRTSGEPVIRIQVEEDTEDNAYRLLAVYDSHSNSKLIDDLGIVEYPFGFLVFPYIETLLLLDYRKHDYSYVTEHDYSYVTEHDYSYVTEHDYSMFILYNDI